LDHERALASIASIIILFTASIVFIFGLIYLSDRAIGWEETFEGGRWDDRQVIYWEWVVAGVLFIASFGAGIAGGIATAKVTRYPLAIGSAMMLLASAIILQWDYRAWMSDQWGEIAFLLILALVAVALLVMAKPAFTDPPPSSGARPPEYATDNYGWSAVQGAGGPEGGTGPEGVGR
jgi:hypothetical protein